MKKKIIRNEIQKEWEDNIKKTLKELKVDNYVIDNIQIAHVIYTNEEEYNRLGHFRLKKGLQI